MLQNESQKAESARPLHRLQAETQQKVLAEYHTERHGEHLHSPYSSCVRIAEAIFFFWFSVVFSPYSGSSNCS